jgi:hypothetical protein
VSLNAACVVRTGDQPGSDSLPCAQSMQSVALYQKGLWRNILEVLLGFQDISVTELLGKMLRLCRATRFAIEDSPTLSKKLLAAREITSILTARNIDDIDVGLKYEHNYLPDRWLCWKDKRVKDFSAIVDKLSCVKQLVLTFESDNFYWDNWSRRFVQRGLYDARTGERILSRPTSPGFFAPYCRCDSCRLAVKFYGPEARRVWGGSLLTWHLLGVEELVLRGHDIHAIQRELGYWLCTVEVVKAAIFKDLEIEQRAILPGVGNRRLYPYYQPRAEYGQHHLFHVTDHWSYRDSCPHGQRVFTLHDPCGSFKLADGKVSCCSACSQNQEPGRESTTLAFGRGAYHWLRRRGW